MFNAFQWNCFNLVDTCNIALILFLKCDVTKFSIPPSLVTQCHTSSTPYALRVTCDVIYGCPLTYNHYTGKLVVTDEISQEVSVEMLTIMSQSRLVTFQRKSTFKSILSKVLTAHAFEL